MKNKPNMENPNSYFVIVSLRRCGSTYLSNELGSYKGVYCEFDFMLRDKQYLQPHHIQIQNNFSYIESIQKFAAGSEPFRGSKITIPEYQFDQVETILRFAMQDKIKIVHIFRPLHEQMISLRIAQQRGIFHVLKDKNQRLPKCYQDSPGFSLSLQVEKPEGLELDPEDINTFCQSVCIIDSEIAKLRKTNPYFFIEYSQISEKIEEILEFIGVNTNGQYSPKLKNQSLKKIINTPHSQIVNNWPQVKPIFEDWEREHQLLTQITND